MLRSEFFYIRMHEVDNHIEDFLNKFKEILDNMTLEEFDTLVKWFYSIFFWLNDMYKSKVVWRKG